MLSQPLLTTQEVADLLRVKDATVRRWIRNKELPAVQFNREWRVCQKHLEGFIRSRLTVDPGSPGSSPDTPEY